MRNQPQNINQLPQRPRFDTASHGRLSKRPRFDTVSLGLWPKYSIIQLFSLHLFFFLFSTIFIGIYPSVVHAQSPVFMPILDSSHVWNFRRYVPMSRDRFYYRHKVGDTPRNFEGNVYYPVLNSVDSLGIHWEPNYEKIWLREDNGKVWSISEKDNDSEVLIIDMHLTLGDIFSLKTSFGDDIMLKVYREDSVTDVTGLKRKRLSLYCLDKDENYTVDWIDGIGASLNFFKGDIAFMCFIDYEIEHTLCMYQDGIQVWEADDSVWYDEEVRYCWKSTNTEDYFKGYFTIYPNPTRDKINFNLPDGFIYPLRYELVQIATGQRLEYGIFESHHATEIEAYYLPMGMYILRMLDAHGKIALSKVVVE